MKPTKPVKTIYPHLLHRMSVWHAQLAITIISTHRLAADSTHTKLSTSPHYHAPSSRVSHTSGTGFASDIDRYTQSVYKPMNKMNKHLSLQERKFAIAKGVLIGSKFSHYGFEDYIRCVGLSV